MKHTFIIAAAVFALAAGCRKKEEMPLVSGTAGPGDAGYTYKLTVEKLDFNWRVDGGDLRIKLKAPVSGWLSAGFEPTKGMQDARMAIGYMENGKPVVVENHGIDPKHHKPDTELGGENNVKDPAVAQAGGVTEVSYAIPLTSPDKLDRPINPDGTLLMLAYGETTEMAQQHALWAEVKVNLKTGAYAEVLLKRGK
jgi:hypothetical protein